MPIALLDWYESSLATMATATVADALTALKNAVDNNVASNPSTAMWQVASSDLVSTAKYVVLKPTTVATTAGARAAMRVMCFGGSAPAAAAINPFVANPTYLYIGIAPDANVDTPNNAFTSAVPFNTGSWQASVLTLSFTSLNRVGYWEYVGGIIIIVRADTMNAASRIAIGMAGEMASSLDHNILYYYLHGGYTTIPASGDITNSSNQGNWVQAEETTANTYPGSFYSIDRTVWTRCAAIFGPRNNTANVAWRDTGGSNFYLPAYCRDITGGTVKMKLRQIAYGPAGIYGDVVTGMSGEIAIKLGHRTDIAEHGAWLTDFNVTC